MAIREPPHCPITLEQRVRKRNLTTNCSYLTESRAAELFMQAAREQPRNQIAEARVIFKPFRATLYSFKIVHTALAHVKFHIVFRRAPEIVLLQAARIILTRRRGRRVIERNSYDAFVRAIPATDFELPGAPRGRRQAFSVPGQYHSLTQSFQRMNREYFQSQLTQPELCWSPARARRLLGSYQERRDRVIISQLFDSPHTPSYVLDYLMYHELLHKFLGIGRRDDGRRSLHNREFRLLERKFRDYKAALKFLKTI
ncbi:MAG: hypothetical protein V1899_08110 [Planctomycetota bacterium]